MRLDSPQVRWTDGTIASLKRPRNVEPSQSLLMRRLVRSVQASNGLTSNKQDRLLIKKTRKSMPWLGRVKGGILRRADDDGTYLLQRAE